MSCSLRDTCIASSFLPHSKLNLFPRSLPKFKGLIPSSSFGAVSTGSYYSFPPQASSKSSSSSSVSMTIKPGFQLVNGRLLNNAGVLLSKVPASVTLTPDSGSTQLNGAFLGAEAPENKPRHVFALGSFDGLRFLCCFRFKLWWMTQRTGSSGHEIPVETQFLLVENKSEEQVLYTVFLPILERSFRSSLQGSENNQLEVCIESGDPAVVTSRGLHAVYIYSGTNPFEAITEAMRAVKLHLQSFSLRVDKKLPQMLDWFGWCTWDAFYTDVSAEGVQSGLKSLSAGGTPARFLIIDDGWQSVAGDNSSEGQVITSGTQFAKRLTDIKENHKFQKPGTAGLEHVVQEAKNNLFLKYVYVWHSVLGYWGGLKPGYYDSKVSYPLISPGIMTNQPDMASDSLTVNGLGLVDPKTIFSFYNDMHSYLAGAGVDGVKVDVQSILETLGTGHGGRVELTKQYQQALEKSIALNFPDNGIIACMSHNNDGVYSSQKTGVVRASDDFWPSDPASHTVHIASVAYNSLFLGEVMQPDWDMFHSLHPAAEFHAAARAIGGCGVYVSDKPGHHDFELLKKLVLPDGSVLRAQLPGRPTRDCLFADPTRDGVSFLKIWNLNKYTGVVGAFNCQGAGWCKENKKYRIHDDSPKTTSGSIRASDVEFIHTLADDSWSGDAILFSHKTGDLVLLPKGGALPVTLEHLQYDVFTVVPLKKLSENFSFSPIGLIKMFNAGGAIASVEYCNSNKRVTILVHGSGEFGAFCSKRPESVFVASSPCNFSYNPECGLFKLELNFMGEEQHCTLEINF